MGYTVWVSIAAAVVLIGGGLLVPAGIAKLVAPGTVRAATNLPGFTSPAVIRVVGGGELLLAAAVFAVGGAWTAAALAAAYFAFAVVAMIQRGRGADCGCFGAARAPTGWSHVVIDLGIGAAALAAAVFGGIANVLGGGGGLAGAEHVAGGVAGLLGGQSALDAVLSAVLLAVAVAGVQQLLTGLPALAAARREEPSP